MSNKNDKNKKSSDNFDRRPIVDPPTNKSPQQVAQAVAAKRKGFYIILLLGITAVGIYAVISSLMPHDTANNQSNQPTNAAYVTASPDYQSVPVHADTLPIDESEPMTDKELEAQNNASQTTSQPAAKEKVLGQAPVSGKIMKDFSESELVYSETMKDWRTHAGVDIAANMDTIVTAIKDGVLKKVYEDSLFGTTVIIHHDDDGIDSVYCNLKDVTTMPIGSKIKMGDVIGKVGRTAVSELEDEPHLHFEIKNDDKYLDPKEYVNFEEVDYNTKEPTATSATAKANASSSETNSPETSTAPSTSTSPSPSTTAAHTFMPDDDSDSYEDEISEETIYLD